MTYILNDNILLLAKSQEFKEYLINEAIKALSILSGVVQSASLTTPPVSPDPDSFYIVPSGATGAWAGQTNRITYPATDFYGVITGWNFYLPYEGLFVWLVGSGLIYFDGTDWIPTSVAPGAGTLPSQSGQAGKFLKTNGGVASWEQIQNEIFGSLILGESTTPTTAADQIRLYQKSDGLIYYRKENNGNEHLLKEDTCIPFYIPQPQAGLVVRYKNNSSTKSLVEIEHQLDSGAANLTLAVNGSPVSTFDSGTTEASITPGTTVANGDIVSITYNTVSAPINSRVQIYLRDL